MNKLHTFYSSMVEFLILIPILSMIVFATIYFAETSMIRVDTVMATRYIAESIKADEPVSEATVRNMYGDMSDPTSPAYWRNNGKIEINTLDVNETEAWPAVDPDVATSNKGIIYDYLMEAYFEFQVSYTLNNGQLEQNIDFDDSQEGRELMDLHIDSEGPDLILGILQQWMAYTEAEITFEYEPRQVPLFAGLPTAGNGDNEGLNQLTKIMRISKKDSKGIEYEKYVSKASVRLDPDNLGRNLSDSIGGSFFAIFNEAAAKLTDAKMTNAVSEYIDNGDGTGAYSREGRDSWVTRIQVDEANPSMISDHVDDTIKILSEDLKNDLTIQLNWEINRDYESSRGEDQEIQIEELKKSVSNLSDRGELFIPDYYCLDLLPQK